MTVEVAGGEQLWQLTVEHSPVGTTLVAPDGRLLSANQALCDMLGYTEREIQTLTFQQITHPDDLAQDLALVERDPGGRAVVVPAAQAVPARRRTCGAR